MDKLSSARAEIDRIDAEMARLFEQRMAAVAKIAAWKQENGRPVRDPDRERELLARNAARIENPALRPYYAAFLEGLVAESRLYQQSLLHRELLWVRTVSGAYPVSIRSGALRQAKALLDLERTVFIVTDDGVPAAYGESLAVQCRHAVIHTVPQGEGSKAPAVLESLLEAILRAGLTRSDCVAAVGGGVVGDLAGLAAALYMRGVDFYYLPTTLLSMVDASVGGKTAANLDGVKNAVGAFWPPKAVLIDPDLLNTLPARQLCNGFAEAVKMALTHDPALFSRFEDPMGYGPVEELIASCLRIKRAVVEADEREGSLRRVLNFGHTLGHGIEAAARGSLLHGECVALGMLPMCAPAVRDRLIPVLERLGLPTSINRAEIDPEAVLAAVSHDKKATADGIMTVFVPRVGAYELQTVSLQTLRERLETLYSAP